MKTGILASLLGGARSEARAAKQTGGSLQDPQDWLVRMFGGSTRSGMDINEHTALQIDTVWACVNAVSDDVSKLPLKVFREKGDRSRNPVPGHPVATLLGRSPNPEMSAKTFRETLQGHAMTWGNGYAEIERRNNFEPINLWPIEPHRVRPMRVGGKIVYRVTQRTGGTRDIASGDVLHVRGLGYNGLVGYSVIAKARESLGLALAAEAFGASFFGNGARPSGALISPQKMTDQARETLRESWTKQHGGTENASRVAVLEGGLTYVPMGLPPEDSQFLQTRQFAVPTICRWYRVPPHKVMDLTKSAFSNIEQQSIDYVNDALLGWVLRWEQEIQMKLLAGMDDSLYVKHNLNGQLRGDSDARQKFYTGGRNAGWLSANDIRELEDLSPLPGDQGDKYLMPLNMVPADQLPPEPEPAQSRALLAFLAGKSPERFVRPIEPMLAEAYRRRLRIISDRLSRSTAKPDEEFWCSHAEHVRGEILSIAECVAGYAEFHAEVSGLPKPPTAAAISVRMTDEYIARARSGPITDDTGNQLAAEQVVWIVSMLTPKENRP